MIQNVKVSPFYALEELILLNVHFIQHGLQMQCNPHQNANWIFHKIGKTCTLTQKTYE